MQAAALLKRRILECREDFTAFFRYCWLNSPDIEIAGFHHEAIEAFTNEKLQYVQWLAPRGHMKCCSRNTLLTLADGSKVSPAEVSDTWIKIRSWDESSGEYTSEDAYIQSNGEQNTVRIKLWSGISLTRSTNEPLWTSRGWVPAGSVEVGDELATPLGDAVVDAGVQAVSPDEAYLLGALVGDGGLTSSPRWSGKDPITKARVGGIVESLGGSMPYIAQYDYRVNGLRAWMREHSILGQSSLTKEVPLAIWQSDLDVVRGFIAGYWDADGSFSRASGQNIIQSASRALLSGVQSLLLRCGIVAKLMPHYVTYKGERRKYWQLLMNTAESRKFFDVMPLCSEKATKYRQQCGAGGKPRKYRIDGNIMWNKVESVDTGREEVWSLCSPRHQTYVGDDVICHNTTLALAFLVWSIGRNPNLKTAIICANDDNAKARLKEVSDVIMTSKMLHMVFPKLKRPPGRDVTWSKTAITVERTLKSRDATVSAFGITSGRLGSRSNLIILDDIVDVKNAITQPELRKQIITKLTAEFMPTLEAGGRIISVATVWTDTDAVALMRDTFHCVGPHAVGTPEDPCAPIWSGLPRHELVSRRAAMGNIEYARAYQNKVLAGDSVPIQPEWIKYYNARILGDPDDMKCVQAYDLAISQTGTGDFFAWVTVLHDIERDMYFIADAGRSRLTFKGQADKVLANYEDFEPNYIAIENAGYQGSLASYLNEQSMHSLPIYTFRARGQSKEQRLLAVTHLIESGKVLFHPRFDPENNIGNKAHQESSPLLEELFAFPYGKNDDMVDAFSSALLTCIQTTRQLVKATKDDDGFVVDPETGAAFRVTVI